MTLDDFLSGLKQRGAILAPAAEQSAIMMANTSLQSMRAAMLPMIIIELYSRTCGINLGNGYIFGPNEIKRGTHYPTPSIIQTNQDLTGTDTMRGMTVFGRNDLFWFAFDSFGTFMMLDSINLRILRKYDEPYRAMSDCLMGGRL